MSDVDTEAKESDALDESPAGLQRRWTLEITAARDAMKDFWDEGEKVVQEFLGKGDHARHRLNLFHSDVEVKSANLAGIPKVRAKRRFADAKDDVARVSATALERLLNTDIERDSDGYRKALKNAKGDWLKPGLGQVRLRYVVETGPSLDPATGQPLIGEDGKPLVKKTREDVETDYVKWWRFLYSPCEVWDDVRWISFGLDLTKEEWERQFPDKPFHRKTKEDGKTEEVKRVFGRAQVEEIWDRDTKSVLFWEEGQKEILKVVKDTLDIPGFFPSPMPLMANVTTSKCLPRAAYYLAKDLYEEAHEIRRRIRKLVTQVKIAGAYDAQNEGLQRLLDDATDGKLIPVKNWLAFTEKGGVQGAIAFLPIKETVEAIIALSQSLSLVKAEIYEITGQSNTMRGQADPNATATAERVMARFGSSRIQSEQDEFARFASEAQRIRAAIIAKHFDAETIVKRSNIDQAETIDAPLPPQPPAMPGMPPPPPPPPPQKIPNAELIGQAIQLLKSDIASFRIDVDADSLAMTDFDAVQQDGVAIMTASAEYFAQWAPLLSNAKIALFAIEMYQQFISTFRGAERFESVIDRFVSDMEEMAAQPPAPPPPDPKLEAAKVQAQAAMQQTQLDGQVHVATAQMDMKAKEMDMQAKAAEHSMKMREMGMKHREMGAGHEMNMREAAQREREMEMMPAKGHD